MKLAFRDDLTWVEVLEDVVWIILGSAAYERAMCWQYYIN